MDKSKINWINYGSKQMKMWANLMYEITSQPEVAIDQMIKDGRFDDAIDISIDMMESSLGVIKYYKNAMKGQ